MEKFHHNQLDSQKIIDHLEDAKGWLDKAKEQYKQANPTHAEMTLNLAQAEVKHAWELSRERYVSKKQVTIPKRKFNHLIAVAASIAVFFGLVFGFRQENVNKYLASIFNPAAKNVAVDSGSKLAMVKINQKELEVAISKEAQRNSENSVEPVSRAAKNDSQPEPEDSSPVVADNKRERSDPESIQNSVRVRPVSQFAIDEDALTQEASHSLRNGK